MKRFFVDSIIMDLDAMEQARRKKQNQEVSTIIKCFQCEHQVVVLVIKDYMWS